MISREHEITFDVNEQDYFKVEFNVCFEDNQPFMADEEYFIWIGPKSFDSEPDLSLGQYFKINVYSVEFCNLPKKYRDDFQSAIEKQFEYFYKSRDWSSEPDCDYL